MNASYSTYHIPRLRHTIQYYSHGRNYHGDREHVINGCRASGRLWPPTVGPTVAGHTFCYRHTTKNADNGCSILNVSINIIYPHVMYAWMQVTCWCLCPLCPQMSASVSHCMQQNRSLLSAWSSLFHQADKKHADSEYSHTHRIRHLLRRFQYSAMKSAS